jgi:hypothetical protein
MEFLQLHSWQLAKLADDNKQYPRAAQVLSNGYYVDLLSGTSTIEDAINMQKEEHASNSRTHIKWASNHSTFLDTIAKELQETQTLSLDNEDGVTTLRLLCNPKNDKLQVKSSLTQMQTINSRQH